jgi:hypothetical protein
MKKILFIDPLGRFAIYEDADGTWWVRTLQK